MKHLGYWAICITIVLFASCVAAESRAEASSDSTEMSVKTDPPYIYNPDPGDTTCIREISRAKADSANGIIAFTYPMAFGSSELRQVKYLRELCKKNKLEFRYEMFGCVVSRGQTQGCYGDYMDQIIAKKYSAGFKDSLLKAADEMLISNHDTVRYYLCDKRPQVPGKNEYDCNMNAVTPDSLRNKIKPGPDGHYPFMDIGFYLDTNGLASNYHLAFFNFGNEEDNKKLKKELFAVAVQTIKQVTVWEPGEINGHKVNTSHNVRVHF